MRSYLIVLASCYFCITSSQGNVSYSQVESFAEGDVALSELIYGSANLEIAPHGDATRLGRQFEHLGGLRIGPYFFPARPVGATVPTLMVEYETKITWILSDGTEITNPEHPPFQATEFLEELESIRFRPLTRAERQTYADSFPLVETPSTDQNTNPPLSPVIPRQPQITPTPEEQPNATTAATALRAEIREQVHAVETNANNWNQAFEIEDEFYSRLDHATAPTGKIVDFTDSSEHAGYGIHVVYGNRNIPLFVFVHQDSWVFHEGGAQTKETREEWRLYFENGQLNHILQRSLSEIIPVNEGISLHESIKEIPHHFLPISECENAALLNELPSRLLQLRTRYTETQLEEIRHMIQSLPEQPE